MSLVSRIANTARFLMMHPIARRERMATLGRFARWQIASRLSPGPIAVPFVAGARLLVEAGMTGATGNVYAGLHEFADMTFVLHALRAEDLFLDIGANVGSYTVLAAAVAGCACICVEPIEGTARKLRDNLALNHIEGLVEVHTCAVGEHEGSVRMTAHQDTTNHVLAVHETGVPGVEVPVRTVDGLLAGRAPAIFKMDVEGHEISALGGARSLLGNAGLRACIVELSLPSRAGPGTAGVVIALMAEHGFSMARYDAWSRTLEEAREPSTTGNTLFVRDWPWVRGRVMSRPGVRVGGLMV